MQVEALMDAPMPGVIGTLWAEGEDAGGGDAGGGDIDLGSGLGDAGSDAGDADAGADDASGDGSDADAGEDDASGDGSDASAAGEELTGSKLWNALKEPLKALDPALQKAVNRAIHKLDGIERKLPGGVEQAVATLTAVKRLAEDPAAPTEKVIADTLAERGYFRELDAAYTAGKPEFIEKLATADGAAFDKLAPQVFAKYSETNPDGFSGYVARTVQQHMAAAEVPLQFRVLATFLPQLPDGPAKDQVVAATESIYGWSQSLDALAKKQPVAKAAADKSGAKGGADELATREQQVAQREQNATLTTWNAEALQPGIRSVYAEADRIAGKQKLSADERKKVLSKVGEELDIRLAGNKGYGEAMRGYLQAGKKTEFIQRLEAERKKLIPGATRRAVDDVVADRKPAKGAAVKTAAKQAGNKQGAAAAGGEGAEKVLWIGGSPTTQNLVVDLNRTSHSMLMKNRAYIKGREGVHAWK